MCIILIYLFVAYNLKFKLLVTKWSKCENFGHFDNVPSLISRNSALGVAKR